ncbi:MAG TPA: signal peptidase I [Gemmataceae bacterium]|nr:signal peptidase I [Gemmataceae bacterium]
MDENCSHPVRAPVLRVIFLVLIGVLLFRALAAEPFTVPSGSMAPTLLGYHKTTRCPRCGFPVTVGCRHDVAQGEEPPLAGASCPNCGCEDLRLEQAAECHGDCLMVNKVAYDWRRPGRWEMIVFWAPCDAGKVFVKRVVALPGEKVQVRDGDVFINGRLARKSLAQLNAVRLPVFDQNCLPATDGWRCRWLADPPDADAGRNRVLYLNASRDDREHALTYRQWSLDHQVEEPIRDTCAYDAGEQDQQLCHDFIVEADLEIRAGHGSVQLQLTDGQDQARARLAVGPGDTTRLSAGAPARSLPHLRLAAGRTYHVEFAFADRRVSLAIDGKCCSESIDLPAATKRLPVSRPVRLAAQGVDLAVHNFRLFRDVYYTPTGQHGIRRPVHLGPAEYFVLGDNSPDSDDSRYWPEPGVPERNILGRPFLVHFPSRIVRWEALGASWACPALDWRRVRWLR